MSNKLQVNEDDYGKIEKRFTELVDETTFKKEVSFAVQLIAKNKQLADTDPNSRLMAVYNIALTGLSLNPVTKYAYLVPRWNSLLRIKECCLEPSYQGLVKLLTDTGSIKNVYVYPVYEGDEFQESLGTNVEITHVPKRKTEIIELVYAVAILHDGSKQIEVMTKAQIDAIRDTSESYKAFDAGKIKSCIWESYYIEMARKTVIKRIIKYLPKTNRFEHVANAIELDNNDYQASENQIGYITQLLQSANITPEQSDVIYAELPTISAVRASEVIAQLKENNLNPMQTGNYGQGDINKQLDEQGLK